MKFLKNGQFDWEYFSNYNLSICWQEYIRDLEKEEDEAKRLQKVLPWTYTRELGHNIVCDRT